MMVAVAVAAVCLAIPLWGRRPYRNYRSAVSSAIRSPRPLARENRRGDRIERVTARNRPHRVTRRGPFVQLFYHPGGPPRAGSISLAGTCVVAKDGKLVAAASWECTFQHTHFDVMSGPTKPSSPAYSSNTRGRRPELGDDP